MIRLKKYKHGYLKILLLTFSFILLLQPALGQDLNDSAQDDKDAIEAAKAKAASSGFQHHKSEQKYESGTIFLSTQEEPEKPDSLSQAQPDSLSQAQPDLKDIDKVLENGKIILVKSLDYLDNHFYSIAGIISVYLLLSQDEDKDAPVIKIGPPPDWPDN